ncbi:MAG: helix-turn-helix domain-containing protein [Paracoccaceae bacterium]
MAEASKPGRLTPTAGLNASQTRAVFAENLRLLLRGHPSVAQVCREIGINRTQFNRYLSSEAFPRPDVLSLICNYFEVDARILLEPLDQIGASSTEQLHGDVDQQISQFIEQSGIGSVDHTRLPAGFYNLFRRASMDEDLASSILCKVSHRSSGRTTIKAIVPRDVCVLLGLPMTIKDRILYGPVLQHGLGVSFSLLMRNRKIVQYNFVEFSYLGNDRIHFGNSLTTHRFGTGPNVVMPVMLIRLDGGWAELMASVRASGIRDMKQLPSNVRSFLRGEDT